MLQTKIHVYVYFLIGQFLKSLIKVFMAFIL